MSVAEALTARGVLPRSSGIRAVGIDIVDVERLRAMAERRGQRLVERFFTVNELALCEGTSPRHRASCMAGRIAAKEAVRKALGGHGEGLGWRDVEIGREASGAPVPRLTGRAGEAFRLAGYSGLHVSISHEAGVAVAIAVAD
ncbi:holo-ACP synthase [Streptomyces sp. NBC_01283]|uniref:holo-ACP synthase n=1 Tax=Streptomyces sp. NBC_01283 TaxID=2903812 RepID=UPI00352CBD00|nr:holo-ACP synthase [Streptomyces sp. NBC_01283]